MGYKYNMKTLERRVSKELEKRRLLDLTSYIEIQPNKYVILSKGLEGCRELLSLSVGIKPEEIGLKYYSLKEIQAQYNEYNSYNYTADFIQSCKELDNAMGVN